MQRLQTEIFFGDASFEELGLVGLREIEDDVLGRRPVARRHHVEPLQRVGLIVGTKFVEEFGSVQMWLSRSWSCVMTFVSRNEAVFVAVCRALKGLSDISR